MNYKQQQQQKDLNIGWRYEKSYEWNPDSSLDHQRFGEIEKKDRRWVFFTSEEVSPTL